MVTFRQPFKGEYPITQDYGEVIPGVTYQGKPHTGIDYACPIGTEILASASGTVMAAGWNQDGYGLYIIIRHTADRSTLYAHLSRIYICKGDQVEQGQVIALSGDSGNVVPKGPAGAHLHFEARKVWNGWQDTINPRALPLMSVDDIMKPEKENQKSEADLLPAGVYQVACQYAFIRYWNSLTRDRALQQGTRVYIFDDVKRNDSGLPFHYIGADLCIAEYDVDGTKILEAVNGSEKEN